MATTIQEQRYGPNTGAVTGWLGVALGLVVAGMLVASGETPRIGVALLVLAGTALIWCLLLRPRILIREPDEMVLRNAFSTWSIPLAAIDLVAVRLVTTVGVGDERYDGTAVGRRVRAIVRGSNQPSSPALFGVRLPAEDRLPASANVPARGPEATADLLTEQALAAASRAKESGQPVWPVRRAWARLEIGVVAVLVLAGVIVLLV